MKTEIIEEENNADEYPKLMVGLNGTLVLFSEPKIGMVMISGRGWEPGHYSTAWTMEGFTDFKGKLVLSND